MKKTPVIYKISLEKFNISQLNCYHIVGDANEVAIAAKINGTMQAKIIILNSKTASVKSVLDITNSEGVHLEVIKMKMSLDDNFLVASICKEDISFYQVWNRKDEYSSNYLKKNFEPQKWLPKTGLIDTHLQNIPVLRDGYICISTRGKKSSVEIEEWKISDNSIRTSIMLTTRENLRNNQRFIQKFGIISYHTDNKMDLISSSDGGFFDIPFGRLTFPKVIGYSDEYIAIYMYHRTEGVLSIFSVPNGRSVLDLYIEPREDWQRLRIPEISYSSGPFCKEGPNQVQVPNVTKKFN